MHYLSVLEGGPSGATGEIADTDTNVTLRVVPNDDPFGVFSFPSTMREASVAEDFKPGEEHLTTVNIPVIRQQGSSGTVTVSYFLSPENLCVFFPAYSWKIIFRINSISKSRLGFPHKCVNYCPQLFQVLWEVFSYQIAGAGLLPPLYDLSFTGTRPSRVAEIQNLRRSGTGSKSLFFVGCPGTYIYVN